MRILHAVRRVGAVADRVVAVLALGALRVDAGLSGRDDRSPRDAEEVRDERLDVVHRVRFLHRRRRQRVVRLVRPVGHGVHDLADDAQALAHLLDVHGGAVVAVAGGADGDVEVEPVVVAVRALLAPVPGQAGRAQHRAGQPPGHGVVDGDRRDPDHPRLHDAVVHHQLVVLVEARRQVVAEVQHALLPALRQVLGDAADAEPVGVHAPAGDGLDDVVEEDLPVLEHVEDRRERADVLGVGAVEDEVAGDAVALAEQHADELRPVRDLDAAELLHREDVGQVVGDPAEVVHAVGVRDVRVPALALGQLLLAAVVVADVGDAGGRSPRRAGRR